MALYLYRVNDETFIWANDRNNAEDIYNGLFDNSGEYKENTERIDNDEVVYFNLLHIYGEVDLINWSIEDKVNNKYERALTLKKFKKLIDLEFGRV